MRFSSRKWAEIISLIASLLFFIVIIITQIPLFRFPCRIGVCETPVEVTVCQLIASDIVPEFVVKALLYPGAIGKYVVTHGTTIPSHDHLLNSFKSEMSELLPTTDIKHLEVVTGSYLCVAGALLGLMKRGRMSLFGVCLIIWGVTREVFMQKHAKSESLCMYPGLMFALVFAVCTVRKDVRKLIRSWKSKRSSSPKLKAKYS